MVAPDLNQIPRQLVGGVASLPDLIVALATLKGTSRPDADCVVDLLPAALKSASCFLDRLTAKWRYIYGVPFDGLPGGRVVFGTHMYHEVDRLIDVIACAQRRLASKTLSGYLTAIGDPLKHQDALVEFAPILRIDSSSDVQYEVPGAGNTTIDWLVRSPGQTDLLLEVKNRGRDLFEGLCRLNVEVVDGVNAQPEPIHDHNLLFRSVENKFLPRSTTETVQAVWIKTDVKQEEIELQSAFHKRRPRTSPRGDLWGLGQ